MMNCKRFLMIQIKKMNLVLSIYLANSASGLFYIKKNYTF